MTIIYHNTNAYNNNTFYYNFSNFLEQKKILLYLTEILKILRSNKHSLKNSKKLLFTILSGLKRKNVLNKKDLQIFKAYLYDLSDIGYIFPKNFYNNMNNEEKEFSNISSEFIYYTPKNPILKANKKIKIIKHSFCEKVYDNILLIIHYNKPGFLKLNEYLEKLYKKFFPHIIYLYPGFNNKDNNPYNSYIISCNESSNGFFSYKCIEKIYNNFPNYRGYLLINDDNFMKVWELENLDFSIPWFYIYEQEINRKWNYYKLCSNLYNMCENNLEWKINVTKFFGMYKIFHGLSDFYYIPNYYVLSLIKLIKKMYDAKIFTECALLTSFAIISSPKNQIIYIRALWDEERERALNVLQKEFKQIFIHPIKFSKEKQKNGVNKYIFFFHAINY